ncbi:MAG: hypothetical protein AB8H03_03435 [Saprospiraceae bacterium]
MKAITLIITVILLTQAKGQNEIIGTYSNHFGEKITLKPDSTFEFKWHFDLAGSWTNGKWKYVKGSITLEPIYIYDTLMVKDENGNFVKDSLVFSLDSYSNKISEEDYAIFLLNSSAQNKVLPPIKLFYKKNKLIVIGENGKLIKKKVRGLRTKKKYRPWYLKRKK